MSFNQSSPNLNPDSITWYVDRGDWCSLTEVLSDPAKHDKSDMAKALSTAADKGLEECTRVLLEAGTPPNIHDASGFTPLIIAAKRGHAEIVKLLLRLCPKCRINKGTFNIRATAIHWAATNGHTECVHHLLRAGANPCVATLNGRTPLMLAARNDEEDILMMLLGRGADVKMKDFEGATALHLAAEEGADTCARELLKAGADINAETKNGTTPIMAAAKKAQPEVLRMFLHRNVNLEKRCNQLTALHWAAMGGSATCVEALIRRGLSPDVKTLDSHFGGDLIVNCGVTPLMLAAERGHDEVIQKLLTYSTAVDECDEEGKTALLYAIHKQRRECVRLLLEADADPDGIVVIYEDDGGIEERGVSPIFTAIKQNNFTTVKLLLQAQCNLCIVGYLKENAYVTPLEFAISKQRSQLARMLMAVGCGADIASQELVQEGLAMLLQNNEKEFIQLAELFCTPPSLLQISRNAIRKSLGKGFCKKKITELQFPAVLKGYIDLNDLDDL